jgi:hypothetical protein
MRYRVATFVEYRGGRKPRFSALLRDYNSQWDGCLIIEVEAQSGIEAKKKAIAVRREMIMLSKKQPPEDGK